MLDPGPWYVSYTLSSNFLISKMITLFTHKVIELLIFWYCYNMDDLLNMEDVSLQYMLKLYTITHF